MNKKKRNDLIREVVKEIIRPKNLKELRLKKKMTLRQLAKKADTSHISIYRIERYGETCTQELFDRLQKALS